MCLFMYVYIKEYKEGRMGFPSYGIVVRHKGKK